VRATDFVLCIDNSASISSAEQELVREIAMLLADLAEPGDRISLIAFGDGARLDTSVTIHDAQDKLAFKQVVQHGLTFRENFSDIRAGLRVMADKAQTLFRPSGAVRAAILLTDGKLEPANHDPAGAFAEMLDLLHGPLAKTNIYAVVLGDTTCNDVVLPNVDGQPLNGMRLMQQYIAGAPDYFFHAHKLDELLDVAVSILSKAKGIGSLGEKGKTQFKIDRTVESMTLIVRKKSSGGAVYCASSDIRLKRTQPQPAVTLNSGSHAEGAPLDALYWSSDYQYFDLITANKPHEGIWEVGLENGNSVDVLSKIVTNIDLQSDARSFYYQNERTTLSAWLFDNKNAAVAREAYQVQAHLADGDNLRGSPVYVQLHPDAQSGRYALEAPMELQKALGKQGKPGPIALEIVADQPSGDPWFIRRSAPVSLEIVPPFVDWVVASAKYTRIPLWQRTLDLGAVFHPSMKDYKYLPDFESPPKLRLVRERFRASDGTYQKDAEEALDGTPQDGNLRYTWKAALPPAGTYRYSYQLTGATRSRGPFSILSPWYEVRVRFPWPELAIAAVLLLAILSGATATLNGRLNVTLPNGDNKTVRVKGQKTFDSQTIAGIPASELRFRLTAKRFLFVKSWIRLEVLRGRPSVGKRELGAGKTLALHPSQTHVLTAKLTAGTVEIRTTVSV
jgi:hypothetical protein